MPELSEYVDTVARNARQAVTELTTATGQQKLRWLKRCADALVSRSDEILTANAKDLAAGTQKGLSAAMLDRLRLTEPRLQNLAAAVVEIGHLPDPVGEIISSCKRPNGLLVTRVRVPLGVIFFIYESRPNVHGRRRRDLCEERERSDSARWQ